MATKTRKTRKTKRSVPEPELLVPLCANCGHRRDRHYSVNFADGPFVTGETLVCPSSIYRERQR